MVYYIIPCLEYMEPFEGANKRLLKHTLDSIQKKFHRRVIVATDQQWALDHVKDMRVKGMQASDHVVEGEGSYKDVLLDIDSKMLMDDDDDFVMLSLEYPGRTYRNIRSAIQFYRKHEEATSLLCRRPSEERPEKFFYQDREDENKGTPVVEDLGQEWKEQEHPDVFKHSFFVTIHQVSELPKVNDWLWNNDTTFFPIDTEILRTVTEEQLDQFESNE